jgi:hypothetical protein
MALAVTLLSLGGVQPARAQGAFVGQCAVNITMTFTSRIYLTSGGTALESMEGLASCVTNAEPLSPVKTFTFAGSAGPGSVSTCGALAISGFYAGVFSPSPAPPPTNGTFSFVGSTAGGLLIMSGTSPTFEGVGVLTGLGSAGCLSTTQPGGSKEFGFVGPLSFLDP